MQDEGQGTAPFTSGVLKHAFCRVESCSQGLYRVFCKVPWTGYITYRKVERLHIGGVMKFEFVYSTQGL
jgi:hypothetical protein